MEGVLGMMGTGKSVKPEQDILSAPREQLKVLEEIEELLLQISTTAKCLQDKSGTIDSENMGMFLESQLLPVNKKIALEQKIIRNTVENYEGKGD